MKYLIKSTFFIVIICLFCSCDLFKSKMGVFKILPTPQKFEIFGYSDLSPNDIVHFYNSKNKKLPPGINFLNEIKASKEEKDAQLIFKIDSNIKLKNEGYFFKYREKKN